LARPVRTDRQVCDYHRFSGEIQRHDPSTSKPPPTGRSSKRDAHSPRLDPDVSLVPVQWMVGASSVSEGAPARQLGRSAAALTVHCGRSVIGRVIELLPSADSDANDDIGWVSGYGL
jgi:hypothetical protein